MLASKLPPDFDLSQDVWFAEEKFDGHRIVIEVIDQPEDLFTTKTILAWSRYGTARILPQHIREGLSLLPQGIYDGELLVIGERSYGVTELANVSRLSFIVFDVMQLLETDTTDIEYRYRRQLLTQIFERVEFPACVQLATATQVHSMQHVIQLRDEVWSRNGEGLILKRQDGIYTPGKRSKLLLKIKDLQSVLTTVVAFQEGKKGPYARVVLKDPEGYELSVKTRNNAELAAFEEHGTNLGYMEEYKHPDIGRKLWVEYQERTPDGNYRHPRWDRWEDQ